MNKSGLYYPELDSLRFLAFLLVLIHHSPYVKSILIWRTLAKYGWMGVDLFLCLSAFLFARLLFVEHQQKGDINISYFYLRRALRIWPLYFFFLGAMLLVSSQQDGFTADMLKRSIGMMTFTDNLLAAFLNYNFAIWFSDHLWTISYEEQFYAIIPWVLRQFYKFKRSITVRILAGATLVGLLLRAVLIYYQVDYPAVWVLPLTHFESIFGGLIVGLGLFDPLMKRVHSWIWFLVGVFSLYLVTRLPNLEELEWSLMATFPLIGIGTTLILFAVMQGNLRPLSDLFKNKFLGYLGKISYGLYVYHLLCIRLAIKLTATLVSPDRFLMYPLTILLLALVITVLVATVSYQILERPFLRLKERFTFIQSRPV